MSDIKFEDNRIEIENTISEKVISFLIEASDEVCSQTKRNSRVKTGQTKGSWTTAVDEDELTAVVGSPLENAIWEEMGTGEYALNSDGRKDGWYYVDEMGNGHFTHGKKPNRPLFNAFNNLKNKIQKQLQQVIGKLNND